jgi:glycosyltransferase involved in cell wall biosynthesis
MVAFHFPPAAMGSGHLRTLGFARYLPDADWHPVVLSAVPRVYPRTLPITDGTIPEGCRLHRAFALDAGRHLAIRGKYLGFLAQPDRWASWWPAAVMQGLRLIRHYHVQAIWSTYPIMTAHCVAHSLSIMTGLPWIADFRDPVASSVSAHNPFAMASQYRWERRVLRRAAKVVFTTPGAARAYAEQYPQARHKLSVIHNGYDETCSNTEAVPRAPRSGPLLLLHSGKLYPDGRDPSAFFAALAKLKHAGAATPGQLQVRLRAAGDEMAYQQQIDDLGIGDLVRLAPHIGSRDALAEQASADGLLLFQGEQFDQQIPAKAYEYLRAGKPIFALVSEKGDTAALLRRLGGAQIAPLDDPQVIERKLIHFIRAARDGGITKPKANLVREYSRKNGAAQLAELLEAAV